MFQNDYEMIKFQNLTPTFWKTFFQIFLMSGLIEGS